MSMHMNAYLGPYLEAVARFGVQERDDCPNKSACPTPKMTRQEVGERMSHYCHLCGMQYKRRFSHFSFLPQAWEKTMDEDRLTLNHSGRRLPDLSCGAWTVNLRKGGPEDRPFYFDQETEVPWNPDLIKAELAWFAAEYDEQIKRIGTAPEATVNLRWGMVLRRR